MPQISLKAARVNANLTQAEVAKRLHKNKQTITNWENGKTKVSAADLLILCDMYKISPSAIQDGLPCSRLALRQIACLRLPLCSVSDRRLRNTEAVSDS